MDKRHKSRYTDNLISDAQFLVEVVLERYAKKDKKELPFKFWRAELWKRQFGLQMIWANQLLKLYSFTAIYNALLKNPSGKKVYSLNAKWLDPIIKHEEDVLKRQKASQQQIVEIAVQNNTDNLPIHRPTFNPNKTDIMDL